MPDYFPLKKNTRLEYSYESTEFSGKARVFLDILNVRKNKSSDVADVRMTFILRDTHKTEYKITKSKKWVTTADGLVIGGRKEFPLPPKEGREWVESPDICKIVSMDAAVRVKAGKFFKCMKIVSRLSGGDSGRSERYYAPNVGYIFEKYSAEDKDCRVELVNMEKLKEVEPKKEKRK